MLPGSVAATAVDAHTHTIMGAEASMTNNNSGVSMVHTVHQLGLIAVQAKHAAETAKATLQTQEWNAQSRKTLRSAITTISASHKLTRAVRRTSVTGERKTEHLHKEVLTVNGPSSDHGPSVRVPLRMGVHGDTIGRDYEAPNVNLSSNPHKLCRKRPGRMSAAELGRACADIDATSRRVIKAPWENPALSAGGSSLFDPTLGGGGVFMKRGEIRSFRPGDTVMCQHRGASQNQKWYGRLGYRGLSGLETYRSDLPDNRLTFKSGPWTLLPSKPMYARCRDQLARSVPQLARTAPRPQSRETWGHFTPDLIFGNYRHLQTCSLHFGDHKGMFGHADTAAKDESAIIIDIVVLNQLWFKLKTDAVGKTWHELSTEVELWSKQRTAHEDKLSKAVMKKRTDDEKRIETLLRRAEFEKEEADAALERLHKERAEFQKAMDNFQVEKEEQEAAVVAAEQDGVVDDEEAKMLQSMKINVQIAEARLKKEKQEFENWEATALREMEEYATVKARCDEQIQEQRKWTETHTLRELERGMLQFNSEYPQWSVLARLHAVQPRPESQKSERPASRGQATTERIEQMAASTRFAMLDIASCICPNDGIEYACVFHDEFIGYEGQWYDCMPAGYGIESLHHRGVEYLGHFENDLWHGWGMLAVKRLASAYLGQFFHLSTLSHASLLALATLTHPLSQERLPSCLRPKPPPPTTSPLSLSPFNPTPQPPHIPPAFSLHIPPPSLSMTSTCRSKNGRK